MPNQDTTEKPAIANIRAFKRRLDWIASKEAELTSEKDQMEAEINAAVQEITSRYRDFSAEQKKIAQRTAEAFDYADQNAGVLFLDGASFRTRSTMITRKQCPPAVAFTKKSLKDADVVASLRDDSELKDFAPAKYALDKSRIKKELQKAGSALAAKLKKCGLKLNSRVSYKVEKKAV